MELSRDKMLWPLLALSLAVNTFGAGFFLTRSFSGPQHDLTRAGAISAIGSVPPPVRARMHAEFAKDETEIQKAWKDVRDARHDVRTAMRAEPFNAAALDAAFANLRGKVEAVQLAIHKATARALSEASAEERAALRAHHHGSEKP